jgi:hypothetical protein
LDCVPATGGLSLGLPMSPSCWPNSLETGRLTSGPRGRRRSFITERVNVCGTCPRIHVDKHRCK